MYGVNLTAKLKKTILQGFFGTTPFYYVCAVSMASLRSGSVRFSEIGKAAERFDPVFQMYVVNHTVRFRCFWVFYGSVRWGFQMS